MGYRKPSTRERRGACPVETPGEGGCGEKCTVPAGAEYGLCPRHAKVVPGIFERYDYLRGIGMAPMQTVASPTDLKLRTYNSFYFVAEHPAFQLVGPAVRPNFSPVGGPHPDWGSLVLPMTCVWAPEWVSRLFDIPFTELFSPQFFSATIPGQPKMKLESGAKVLRAALDNPVLLSQLSALAALGADVEYQLAVIATLGATVEASPPSTKAP